MINTIKINCENRFYSHKDKDFIGVSNENEVEKLRIELDEEKIIEDTIPYLEIEFPDMTKKIIQMNRKSDTEAEIEIKNSLLKQEGCLKLQFVLINNDNTVFKSEIFELKVLEAINATENLEDDYPGILTRIDELEKKVDNMQFDTFNYDNLQNKPQINQVELDGNKELSELGLKEMTNSEIEKLLEMED